MRKGSYVTTIIVLIIGLCWTIVSAIFGTINAVSNPISWIMTYNGLLIWNSAAAFCYLLAVSIFGGEFNARLKNSAPISQIVRLGPLGVPDWESEKIGSLGYSYW